MYYYRAMLEGVGIPVEGPPDASLRCPEQWRARADVLLGDRGPWIGVNPGAFFGAAKRWLPERYAAVADMVARRWGARVALVGGPKERHLADTIAEGMQAPARVLAGQTTLGELVGVLSRLHLFLTNDSGPMHLAAALSVPTVAVFGPTDARETGPYSSKARVVREPVDCSPCLYRDCPIDHRCMERVSSERVYDEAVGLVSS